jgi:virginiamycin B lyase
MRSGPAILSGLAVIACSGGTPGPSASGSAEPTPTATEISQATPGATRRAQPTTSASLRVPPTPLNPAPTLPPIVDISRTAATKITATELSDWIVVGSGSVWVSGLCDGVGRLDPAHGAVLPCAAIPEGPCGAMEAAFGSIWTATCDVAGVARIDPATSAVITIPLTDSITDSESSVGAGEGGVWVVVGTAQQSLVKIDPTSNTVAGSYPISSGARGVRVGFGSVWVANAIENTLSRVDPRDGSVDAVIGVGDQSQFLAIGDDAVWVLNQGEGTVSRVDPATDTVTATIAVGQPLTGDIVVGEGSVWVRGAWDGGGTMLVRIDPHTDRVVARYGPDVGGGGVAVSDGVAWISSEDRSTIWRLPLR